MGKPFRKEISYTFKVLDEIFAVVTYNAESVYFEETRKNGQEDTHVSGEVFLNPDGGWEWQDDDGAYMVRTYRGQHCADAILKFFNEHGSPTDRNSET